MDQQTIVDRFNDNRDPAMKTLNGRVVAFEPESGACTMEFRASREMCHSVQGHLRGGIVQGGFVAGFLDSAMACACIGRSRFTVAVPSLELKVSYLAPVHPGAVRVEARIRRWGRSICFLEAELFDAEGELLATASSTAKIVPMRTELAAAAG